MSFLITNKFNSKIIKNSITFVLLSFILSSFNAIASQWDDFLLKNDIWSINIEKDKSKLSKLNLYYLDKSKTALQSLKESSIFNHKFTNARILLDEKEKNNIKVIEISIYNRGDNGKLSQEKFKEKLDSIKNEIKKKLSTTPNFFKNRRSIVGVKTWYWKLKKSYILIESSESGVEDEKEYRAEFIRLKVVKNNQLYKKNKAKNKRYLKRNIDKSSSGDVIIKGIPMVDQGDKGYCVAAVVERIFRYYGLSVDQHEIAQIANTSASRGTYTSEMYETLKKMRNKFKFNILEIENLDFYNWKKIFNRYDMYAKRKKAYVLNKDCYELSDCLGRIDSNIWLNTKKNTGYASRFEKKLKHYIDDGVPICWSVFMGIYNEENLNVERLNGISGHMRLIIGYNFKKSKEKYIFYSDTWGAGHEIKKMTFGEAYAMTSGAYAIIPSSF